MIQKINLLPLEEDDDITIKRVVVKLPTEEKEIPRREWYVFPLIILQEVLYFCILIELCILAYTYLVGYPVYRIVSIIVAVILWINVAVATGRNKIKEAFFQGTHEKKDMKSFLSKDTATYLAALKHEKIHKTGRL